MHMSTTTTALTARETAKLALLEAIAGSNTTGEQPSKADLSRGLPTKTRANRYQQIDALIRLGLVVNASTSPAAYALQVTDLGVAEIAAWN